MARFILEIMIYDSLFWFYFNGITPSCQIRDNQLSVTEYELVICIVSMRVVPNFFKSKDHFFLLLKKKNLHNGKFGTKQSRGGKNKKT